ncbi:serine hydrolase [Actinomadura meridiana]|uniref:serine hydrolase n=1 Tax=Actinomadura meridiana TaxID=559626 RepID=UPI0031EA7E48
MKILVALDYLERNKPSASDRKLLTVMLRSSDDKAATAFWTRGGRKQIIERMVARLGLTETAPPPDEKPGFWGYTALSARDVVKTYRYLLEKAPKAQREFVLAQLSKSTPCGTDGFDQTFGIPSAAKRPWAVKQGWSGFGDVPAEPCRGRSAQQVAYRPDLGIGRPVLHTTGVVGDKIVVVLTLQPAGSSFRAASRRVTELARQLV